MLAILALKQIERKYDYACNCGLKTDIDGKILYFDQYRDLNRKKIFWFIIWDHDRSHNRKRDYQYSITTWQCLVPTVAVVYWRKWPSDAIHHPTLPRRLST